MSEHTIYLIGGEDDETSTLTTARENNLCHITFCYRDRVIQASDTDFFSAFCKIRLQLEADHLIPFCYGASLNVRPSGMGRDMAAGLTAYRFTIGRIADPDTLVDIFDSGHDVIPSYVASQEKFFNEWLQSKKA